MILDKLTLKAESVLKSLPKDKKTVSINTIIDAIVSANGLGKILIQSVVPSFKNRKTVDIERFVKEAYYQAIKFDHPFVGTEHLVMALLRLTGSTDYNKTRTELLKYNVFSTNTKSFDFSPNTPLINQFGTNLSYRAVKELDKVLVEREVFKSLVSSLMLKNSYGVLLVGENGVGRSSLIELLARKTTSLDVPLPLLGYKIIEIDFLNFMLSTFSKGGMDTGITSLVDELSSLGKVIVVLKNFENIFLSTSAGLSIPLAYTLFRNTLGENNIKMVAKVTLDLYEKISSEQESVLEGFTVVDVFEPSDKEAMSILKGARDYLEDFHDVELSDDILQYTYDKSHEYLPDISYPKKALMVLDAACSHVIMKNSRVNSKYRDLMNKSFDLLSSMDAYVDEGKFDEANDKRLDLLKTESLLETMEEKVLLDKKLSSVTYNIIDYVLDVVFAKRSLKKDYKISQLSNLHTRVQQKIIGQDDAVSKTVKALIRAKLGLRTKKRPLGNFLFLGPTGVGKTELAKVLATSFYDSNSLIRLDMSDFGEKHTVSRLIGAPPGYIGYGEGGELTSKISSNPNSVVLFDEIEKAHPDVLNILLQIMEEGELKDAKGQTYDFSQSVVILTSNAGTDIVHTNAIGFSVGNIEHAELETRLKNNLKKIMKPELINRFDDVIIFKQLTKQDQTKILDLLLKEVKRSLEKQEITLHLSNDVKDYLLEKGYSHEFGARSLRRVVESQLLDKIADHLLQNTNRPLSLKPKISDGSIII